MSAIASRVVLAVVAGVALLLLSASLLMPPPLSGRLHPAHVPAALAMMTLLAAGLCLARRGQRPEAWVSACEPAEPATWRGIGCAVLAVAVLALGTRSAGLLPAVAVAGCVAALGVRGVGFPRAVMTGAGLACLAGALFVGLLRQPLPLLPGVW